MADFSARGEVKRAPRLSSVLTPQNIVAFSDSSHSEDYNPWISSEGAGNKTPSSQRAWVISNPASGDFTRFRHGDGEEFVIIANKGTYPRKSRSRASFSFLDGHGELLSPYEAYQFAPDPDWATWNAGGKKLYWKHWINKMQPE